MLSLIDKLSSRTSFEKTGFKLLFTEGPFISSLIIVSPSISSLFITLSSLEISALLLSLEESK
jgi:hypothetical protein